MSETTRQKLIPIICVVAGVVTAVTAGTLSRQSKAEADRSVRTTFENLAPAEQTLILGKAKSLREKWEADPTERERILQIHQAVQNDATLKARLDQFQTWWSSLERKEKNLLRSPDGFVANWSEAAQALFIQTNNRSAEIVVKFPPMKFTESNFENFLTAAIGEPLPTGLKNRLQNLSGSDQTCEQTLTKAVWLAEQLLPLAETRPGVRPGLEIDLSVVRDACLDHLLSATEDEATRRLNEMLARTSEEDLRGFMPIAFLTKSGLDHYYEKFYSKHLGNQRDNLVQLFDSKDRDSQLQLLKMDPEEARKVLNGLLIRERPALDPAVADLADGLERIQSNFRRVTQSRFGGGRGGGRPSSGTGGSGRGGPPEEGGDRGGFRPDRDRAEDDGVRSRSPDKRPQAE